MGSFNVTCAVSGLPITPGMPVRYLLLTTNRKKRERENIFPLYTTDWFMPRTFPLRAKYYDCGDLVDVQTGPQRDVWMTCFQEDLVERGAGDNPCHDKAVFKDRLKFEDITDLIHEAVLYVEIWPGSTRDAAAPRPDPQPDVASGIPNLHTVRYLIEAEGHEVVPDWNRPGFLIAQSVHGEVTVRWSQYGDKLPRLGEIRLALEKHYQVILVHGPMLRVFPKYEAEYTYEHNPFQRDAHAAVAKAFIREDVWQALLTMKLEDWRLREFTMEKFMGYAHEMADKYRAHVAIQKSLDAKHPSEMSFEEMKVWLGRRSQPDLCDWDNPNPISHLLTFDKTVTIGLWHHYKAFMESNPSEEETEEFLRVVAEMAFVSTVLSHTNTMWEPSRYAGQGTNSEVRSSLLHKLAEVASTWHLALENDL